LGTRDRAFAALIGVFKDAVEDEAAFAFTFEDEVAI